MARPKKLPHEGRTLVVTARVTQAEKITAQEHASACGLDVSAMIRQALLDGEIVHHHSFTQADTALISELNRIGNNMNQIARNMNSGRREKLDVDLAIAELRGVLEQVASNYGA